MVKLRELLRTRTNASDSEDDLDKRKKSENTG
jgi:hypothetical protein